VAAARVGDFPFRLSVGDLLEFLGWRTTPPLLPVRRGDHIRILEVDAESGMVVFEDARQGVQIAAFGGGVSGTFFRNGEWRLVRGGVAASKVKPLEE
jgi:hypothetical protein